MYGNYEQKKRNFGYNEPSYQQSASSRIQARSFPQYDEPIAENTQYYNNYTNKRNNLEFNANEFELQNALDNEVRKNRELKYKYESQLDHEINNRQDLEERLNKLKDESIKRENYIIEIEQKITSLDNENQQLIEENSQLKLDLDHSQNRFQGKVLEITNKAQAQQYTFQSNQDKLRYELEHVKQQQAKQIDQYHREKEQRENYWEEKIRIIQLEKNALEDEIQRLEDQNLNQKLENEEVIRETIAEVQEDEMKKYLLGIRQLEVKIKNMDEAYNNVVQKNERLIQEIQDKERQYRNREFELENENNRLKQQGGDLQMTNQQIQILRERFRNELQGRDNIIQKLEADALEQQRAIKYLRDVSKKDIQEKELEFIREKKALQDIRDQQAKRIHDLEKVVQSMDQQINQLHSNQDQFFSNLQTNFQQTIRQALPNRTNNPINLTPSKLPKYE